MPCQPREGDWWRDSQQLAEEIEAHGTNSEIARIHGRSETLYRRWRDRAGFAVSEAVNAHPTPGPHLTLVPDDGWLLKALKKSKDRATVEELADRADVSPRKVREAMARLSADGYRIGEDDSRVVLSRVPAASDNVHKALFDGEVYRFAALGDTHSSSKHERLEELHLAYDIIADEGVTDVYHQGDFTCGVGIFPGQINEIKNFTYESQVEYLVANYPVRDGITTHGIGGNHDLEGEFGRAGANPALAFANQRPDIDYLGDYHASIEFEQGTRMYMLHPKGSMGYAMDYKARKLVEGFEGGRKPNVMLVGHFHRAGWIEPRSVHVLFTACFESGGSFGPRLGLPDPSVGFYIVEMRIADDGSVVSFKPEFRKFFPGRKVKAA